jgi:hypothetical protein
MPGTSGMTPLSGNQLAMTAAPEADHETPGRRIPPNLFVLMNRGTMLAENLVVDLHCFRQRALFGRTTASRYQLDTSSFPVSWRRARVRVIVGPSNGPRGHRPRMPGWGVRACGRPPSSHPLEWIDVRHPREWSHNFRAVQSVDGPLSGLLARLQCMANLALLSAVSCHLPPLCSY